MPILDGVKRDEPYVFISYANADRIQVIADVIRLQNAGVNLMIDTELQRYSGERWKDVVAGAIHSPYCKGIMLFVSKFSLSSDAVKYELELSCSETVRGMHYGKTLKIIPIKVAEFDDLEKYCYMIAEEFGKAVSTSEIQEMSKFQPGLNVISINERFFKGQGILFNSIYDKKDIEPVIESLRRIGLKIDGGRMPQSHNANMGQLLKKGNEYLQSGNVVEAIKCFEELAISGNADVYIILGKIYARKKNAVKLDYKIAESCFIRASDLGSEWAKLELAAFLLGIKQKERAKKYAMETRETFLYSNDSKMKKLCDSIVKKCDEQ